MNGHQLIIDLRRAGRKPSFLWVSDLEKTHMDGVTVCVAGDTPELLDLRFLVGVTALVEGQDEKRVQRIAAACQKFASRVVASVVHQVNEYRWETQSITDTDGVMTWHK